MISLFEYVSFADKAANYYIVNRFVWTLILSHHVCCSIFVNCMIIAGGSKPIFLYCDLSVLKSMYEGLTTL